MSAPNLQSLVNAKAALDLGLLNADDYNRVKESFLKAQQLRSAIDAGLIESGPQVEQAREEFTGMVLRGEGAPPVPAAPRPTPRQRDILTDVRTPRSSEEDSRECLRPAASGGWEWHVTVERHCLENIFYIACS